MVTVKRLFLAIDVPAPLKERLLDVQRRLQVYFEEATWVRAEGIHLTLKFLGETPLDRISAIRKSCEAVVQPFSSFSLTLEGLGAFPHWQRPRVLWVGVHHHPVLMALQAAIEQAMADLGYARESRPFAPHLTLARIKRSQPVVVQRMLEMEQALIKRTFGDVSVDRVILFESQLHPQGAIYIPLATFPLR